jgi:hypothetical protein
MVIVYLFMHNTLAVFLISRVYCERRRTFVLVWFAARTIQQTKFDTREGKLRIAGLAVKPNTEYENKQKLD